VTSEELQRDWLAVMIGDRSGNALLESQMADETSIDTERDAPVLAMAISSDDANPYTPPKSDSEVPVKPSRDAAVRERQFQPGHVPLVLSAAIFAMLHYGQGPAPIPLFFLALGLGYLYRQTHRAAPSIVVHLMINSLSMAVMWIGLMLKS
jgi:hypothetical protein